MVSWQDAQLPVTPACTWLVEGAGVWNPEPGALPMLVTGADGATWQFSHVVDVGRWELLTGVDTGGITTRPGTP